MTPISSRSNTWAESYDQNTGGRPDNITERPNGQLQPPFQNSAESFHHKDVSGLCFPSVRTVSLMLHIITLIRLERPVHGVWRPNGWTSSTRLALSRIEFGREHYIVRIVAAVFPYLCFGKKSFYLSNTERCLDVLLRRPDGCNWEQFEASGHQGTSGRKDLVVWTNDALTDKRLDGIPRRPDGCKGIELHCFESA